MTIVRVWTADQSCDRQGAHAEGPHRLAAERGRYSPKRLAAVRKWSARNWWSRFSFTRSALPAG